MTLKIGSDEAAPLIEDDETINNYQKEQADKDQRLVAILQILLLKKR